MAIPNLSLISSIPPSLFKDLLALIFGCDIDHAAYFGPGISESGKCHRISNGMRNSILKTTAMAAIIVLITKVIADMMANKKVLVSYGCEDMVLD